MSGEQDKEDFEAIRKMIARGNSSGLLVEILDLYTSYIRQGETVKMAAAQACYDWDA